MAAPSDNHIADNGLHLVVHTKRSDQHNVGEVGGYSPEKADHLVNKQPKEPAAAYAARVLFKKDQTDGRKEKAGEHHAISRERAAELVKRGEAEYLHRLVLLADVKGRAGVVLYPAGSVVSHGATKAAEMVKKGEAEWVGEPPAAPAEAKAPEAKKDEKAAK